MALRYTYLNLQTGRGKRWIRHDYCDGKSGEMQKSVRSARPVSTVGVAEHACPCS